MKSDKGTLFFLVSSASLASNAAHQQQHFLKALCLPWQMEMLVVLEAISIGFGMPLSWSILAASIRLIPLMDAHPPRPSLPSF